MTAISQGEATQTSRRRRPRFGSRRVSWWPLLLIPVLVWAVYAIGTPWPESAPVGASLEMYGEPLDIQDMQRVLRDHGHELTVQSIHLERRNHAGRSIGLHKDSFMRAKVKFDGAEASMNVYPDVASVERDWVDWDGSLQPRDSYVWDVSFTKIENVVVVESGWLDRGNLGETLASLHQ